MTRNTLNVLIDAITALLALSMVLTGVMLRWVLPPGSGQQRTLWGLDRHAWGDIHWWLAVVLVGVVIVHVALHWRWVCTMAGRVFARKQGAPSKRASQLAGVTTGVVLALGLWGFVAIAGSSVQTQAGALPAHLTTRSMALRGSTTLGEAAQLLRVDVATLCTRLGVDPDLPPDQRLGRIAQDNGMRLSEIRRLALSEQ